MNSHNVPIYVRYQTGWEKRLKLASRAVVTLEANVAIAIAYIFACIIAIAYYCYSLGSEVTKTPVMNNVSTESEGRFNGNSCFTGTVCLCGVSRNYWHLRDTQDAAFKDLKNKK